MKTIAHKKLLALNRFVKAISLDNSQLAHALGVMVLAYHDCLDNLRPVEFDAAITDAPAKESPSSDFVELSCDHISFFMNELYLKVKSAVHESVLPFLKEPRALTPENCEKLKKYFLSLKDAKSDLHELEIGNAYQLNSQLQRKIALTQIQASNKDLSNNEIVLFTQLYTPKWVVDVILDNTIGKEDAHTDPKIASMIDPACGAGHFLLPTFELLLKKLVTGGLSEREAVELLARENLCGVDIDPNGVWMSTLSLTVRCLRLKNPFTPQFSQIQWLTSESQSDAQLLGTLDRSYDNIASHPLSKRYKFVLTNPPYIGRKLLSRRQKQLLKTHYPDENHDISVAFTRRCLELLSQDGKLGVITQSSILYLPSSRQFRQTLIDKYYPSIAVEAGIGVFSMQSGEKIDSLILVLESKSQNTAKESLFIDLRKDVEKALVLEDLLRDIEQGLQNSHRVFRRNIESFDRFPHLQFNYACPASAVKLLEKFPLLEEVTDVRQGLATTDNERFLRYVWDVSPADLNQIWFPYVKGAGSQRWASPIFNVVNWENSGQKIKAAVVEAYPYLKGKYHWVVKNEQFYFREGLSFSFINNANFSVRTLPEGCIFDVAASALFPQNVSRHAILAYLNSSFASKMAHLANPTINFQVGDVKRLPWPNFDVEKQHDLENLALECIKTTQELFSA
ncbi:MAG: N-6 DNA methylase, partial [Leptolyngbya sp.]|nr:N-6 DNA methylase [Candidatus Melainabacteria bacterium]